MFESREPEELAGFAHTVVQAASWLAGRPEDLALAPGAEENMAWLPEWPANLVFEFGQAGLVAEAAAVGDALGRIDLANESMYASDTVYALAEEEDDFEARSDIYERLEQGPPLPTPSPMFSSDPGLPSANRLTRRRLERGRIVPGHGRRRRPRHRIE